MSARRHFLVRLLGAAAGVLLVQGCDRPQQEDEGEGQRRLEAGQPILCVGDSLTAGQGATPQESYPPSTTQLTTDRRASPVSSGRG